MAVANLIISGSIQTGRFEELACSPTFTAEIHQELIYFSTVNNLLSVTAFLGNILILVALHKESSLHPSSKLLYRCLATTDLCVGLVTQPFIATFCMSIVLEDWSLCRYALDTAFIAADTLGLVSLFTLTAISVNRRLALLLGLRYRQVLTLKRTYMIVATFWVVSGVAALCYILDPLVASWYGNVVILCCLVISVASYTKIFRALSHHHGQVQDHVQQQPRQPNALNMARYKKAVYSALWVQLALVVCYLPYGIVVIVETYSKPHSSHFFVSRGITAALVSFNSTLNPFLYCWKIREVRQAVKQTIRQALCCPWS